MPAISLRSGAFFRSKNNFDLKIVVLLDGISKVRGFQSWVKTLMAQKLMQKTYHRCQINI